MALGRTSRLEKGCFLSLSWALLACLMCLSGCGDPSARERVGYELTLPLGWQTTNVDRYPVPGKALEAWDGPEGGSLTVFETLPIPNATAESLLEETVNRWSNLPQWTIGEKKTTQVAGFPAVWIEVVAQGAGHSLAPTGQGRPINSQGQPLQPTYRLYVAILLNSRVLHLMFHGPEDSLQSLKTQWDTILGSLKIDPAKAKANSASTY